MIKNRKLFNIINIVDVFIIAFLVLCIFAFFLVKTGRYQTSSKVIEKVSIINFDVMLRAEKITSKNPVFKVGEKSFLTIRNVPYTDLEIINVWKSHYQTIIPDLNNPQKAVAVDDLSSPNTYNFVVTLKDKATITKDGAVIGGNKIKIGLPVMLEGFSYKLSGVVSDVRIVENQ
ncbi:MAG: DUF4330 domain-containing protein [Candidatus Gastranaerophilales bacterium]|nr:DUF4330 domain-containing protein [Candidatus Gastranaerophilales bacterium]